MVEKLVGRAFVGTESLHEQACQNQVAALLEHLVFRGYPFVRFLRGVGQAAEEVLHGMLCDFRIGHGFHPNVGDFGIERVGGLEHGGQQLAFPDVFFPQGLGQVVVCGKLGGDGAESGKFHPEVQFIVHAVFTHVGRSHTVHGEAQLCFYLSDGCGYVHYSLQ